MLLPPEEGYTNGGEGNSSAVATTCSSTQVHVGRDEADAQNDSMPTTELIGRLRVRVVEAKGLAVPEGRICKPYVLLQYDRTEYVESCLLLPRRVKPHR